MSPLRATDLGGRAALVLGGAEGIGYAVADLLGGAGAAVTVADEPGPALGRAAIRLGVEARPCDFAVAGEAAAAVVAARAEHGRLDLLVCAQARGAEAYAEATTAAIEAAAEAMVAGGEGGRIVVVGLPDSVDRVGSAAAEDAADADLRRLVGAAATELAPRRIAVNLVLPGWVRTPAYEADPPPSEADLNPIGMVAEPEDVARAAVWLLDFENLFVVGAALAVDGGRRAAG
jgi:NAD(P)-dependent dehydrogenase (short-subunit alcohol dehydrogenase family)